MVESEKKGVPAGLNRIRKSARSYVGVDEAKPTPGELNLAYAESPIGPPPEYRQIRRELELSGAFAEAGGGGYKEVHVEPAIQDVRERFMIGEDPYVVFSGGGSDEILERIMVWLKSEKTRVWGIAPQFTDVAKFATWTDGAVSYGGVQAHLGVTLEESMLKEIRRRRDSKLPQDDSIAYVDNPNNPTGDVASADTIEELVKLSNEKGNRLVVIDEVFADGLPDAESAIKLTEKYSNVIVVRSFSKMGGLSGERIGYAVMSKELGELYELLRRSYDLDGPKQVLINAVCRNEIMLPHFEKARDATIEMKTEFMEALDEAGIKYLHTDPRVPIITIDGEGETFADNLSLAAVPGRSYFDTHREASNRYARLAISNKMSIPVAISRIVGARRMAVELYE